MDRDSQAASFAATSRDGRWLPRTLGEDDEFVIQFILGGGHTSLKRRQTGLF
jgi:hypothetical protein